MVMSLPTDQDVPGAIPGSAVGFFLGEDYSSISNDWVFLCFLFMFRPVLSSGVSGGSAIMHVVHINFQKP